MTPRMREILERKITYYPSFHEFGGCFTYQEIAFLLRNTHNHETMPQYYLDKVAKGDIKSAWFYFQSWRKK